MITKLTIETFITKANIVHNNRYNYDLVEYVNSRTKIKIICPIHGLFEQVAKEHLRGRGCSKCGKESKALTQASQAKSEFKDKASLVHNNKYDYSLVEYINSRTKIKIICPVHGTWEQKPNDHLNGQGCPKCAYESKATPIQEFKERASVIHNSKYSYELVDYKNNYNKIDIICPIHGEFTQTASNHLAGSGCPYCAREEQGWTKSKFKDKCIKNNNGLGILYILECFNEQEKFFKIGITSRSIKQRYSSKVQMPYAYSIVKEIVGDPEYIYDLETKLHKEHKDFRYTPKLFFKGNTECFNVSINSNHT